MGKTEKITPYVHIDLIDSCFDSQSAFDSCYNHVLLPDGSPWLFFARSEKYYFIRVHNLVDYRFDPLNGEILYHSRSTTGQDTLDHLFVHQILPLIYSHFGLTVIHASALAVTVDKQECGIAFSGETGQGKSTMVGSFCNAGFPMLTDDCLILKLENSQITGYPGHPSLRLWDDSADYFYGSRISTLKSVAEYTSKKRVLPEEVNFKQIDNPIPMKHFYFLKNSSERDSNPLIEIQSLSSREAFLELIQNAFRLDPTDKEKLSQEFEVLSQMARYPIYFRLSYPRDYSRLPDVRQAILDHLQA